MQLQKEVCTKLCEALKKVMSFDNDQNGCEKIGPSPHKIMIMAFPFKEGSPNNLRLIEFYALLLSQRNIFLSIYVMPRPVQL